MAALFISISSQSCCTAGLRARSRRRGESGSYERISELQAYVIGWARKLTDGGQNPTVRRENPESGFVAY